MRRPLLRLRSAMSTSAGLALLFALALALGSTAPMSPAQALAQGRRGGRHRLPKGTPYAAEVIATIVGTAHLEYKEKWETFDVCETESEKSDVAQTFDFRWNARYPQVTVPVAGLDTLGKAASFLTVPVQPTSRGTGGLKRSKFEIEGHDPLTAEGNQGAGGSDCQQGSYSATGHFVSSRPSFSVAQKSDNLGARRLFVFNLGQIARSVPTTVTAADGSVGRPVTELDNAVGLLPSNQQDVLHSLVDHHTVAGDFPLGKLEPLVHSAKVTLPEERWAGTRDCGVPPDEAGSDECSVKWKFDYRVKLTRRFLYRTKHSYRK